MNSNGGRRGQGRIRILVLGPNPLQTSVWSTAISAAPSLALAGSHTTVDEILPLVPDCDVVLLNAAQQVEQGVEWVRQITRVHPESRIVVAGIPSQEHVILAYIEAGALAYVAQDETVERVLDALPAVLRGEAFVAPDVVPALIGRLTRLHQAYIEPETAGSRLGTLTPRERQVLGLLAECLSNREIADRLLIEIGTVKNHVHNVLDKLEMNNRRQAASYLRACAENGLLPEGGENDASARGGPARTPVQGNEIAGGKAARAGAEGERPGNGRMRDRRGDAAESPR